MRLEINTDTNEFTVTLSRRNLLALLAKLDEENSARTLISDNCYKNSTFDISVLIVKAEHDSKHYGSRKPGVIASSTLKIMNKYDEL
jgi:hypothetical protein